jgi:hypothetical protein
MSNILYYLVGAMPIFFAFVFSYMCMLGDKKKFSTVTDTLFTLIALLAGDEVQPFLTDSSELGPIGLVYGFGFCMLFLVSIHNVFIFLITEGYEKEIEFEKS